MKGLFSILALLFFTFSFAQQSYSVLKTDQYGFPVKTGEIVKVNENVTDVYQYAEFGIPVKTQTAVSDYNNNIYIYEYDNLGQQRQTTQIVNNNFNYQSYDANLSQFDYRYQQPNITTNTTASSIIPRLYYLDYR